MSDNLQIIVDEMREELARGIGGFWSIQHDKLAQPLFFEVVPDGTSWLVFAECGDQRLMWGDAVDPKAVLSNLYVLLRHFIRVLAEPVAKPS